MDEEIERLIVSVRADTAGFARDVAEMRGSMEGPLEAGAKRAGHAIEGALLKAIRTGKLGFDDLAKVTLSVLEAIAKAATSGGAPMGAKLPGIPFPGWPSLPGRATGGPVSPMRPYWVGERGPELFVPTSAGQVMPGGGGAREIRVAITVNAAGGDAPRALAQSSRQVARAVKAALAGVE